MPKPVMTSDRIRAAGWEALVKTLGVTHATRFILQYKPGSGDYGRVKEQLFGRKTVEELCSEILPKGKKPRK